MKKALLVFVLVFSISLTFAQEQQEESVEIVEKQNELKINMTNLIIFKFVDFTYERVLNEESAIGVGLLFNLDTEDNDGLNEYRTFSLTPYYRHYFSNQYAEGFFVEGFAMIHTGEDDDIYIYDDVNDPTFGGNYTNKKYTDLAVGISAGFKAVSNRGFVAEVYLGIGRDLLGNSDIEVVGRGGISLGFRF